MKLTDCGASIFGDSSGRKGLGVIFECPTCVAMGLPISMRECIPVHFTNPIDGGPPAALRRTDLAGKLHEPPTWKREGDTLETLTLSPSIDASSHDHRGHKGWHGHVAAGEVSP